MSDRADVAEALGYAFLDGEWTDPGELARRGAQCVSRRAAALWPIAVSALQAYRDPPRDRPHELIHFIRSEADFDRLWRRRPHPEVRRLALPVVAMGRRRWPVPQLDTVADLAVWLDVDLAHLDWFADVRSMERHGSHRLMHYDRTWIRGRRGQLRMLEIPRPRLRSIQRRILRDMLDLVPSHDAAHGFIRGRSVVGYAAPHSGRDVVIHLDLSSFFASVTAARIFGAFRMLAYAEPVAHLLTGLATTRAPASMLNLAPPAWHGDDIDPRRDLLRRLATPHLAQGAPTSPALANLVCYRLDARLAGLARASGAAYSRYADDLALSLSGPDAQRCARRLMDGARRVIADEGFAINKRKTRKASSKRRQLLCGIVVNQRMTVPRQQYDALRATLHNCVRFGPESQNRLQHNDFRAHLLGNIAWVASIDPVRGERLREKFETIDWQTATEKSR